MERAVVHAVDPDVLRREHVNHPLGQPIEVIFGVVAAPNPRLVRDDDEEMAGGLGGSAEVEDAVDESEVGRRVNVVALDVDHAVAVEEDGRSDVL
jgi:hypothetical protein